MQNCESLGLYGALVLIVTSGFILIPYLRGKADLISAWNFLLLGIAIFVGFGGIEAAQSPMRFQGLDWFQPTKAEVNWYIAATTIFLITLFAAYYFDPLSRKIAARTFNNWPPISNGVLLFTFAICCVFVALSQIGSLMGATFFGPFLLKVALKSFVFATVFSFVLWYRQKVKIIWLVLFI
jgi:hypothetical protein